MSKNLSWHQDQTSSSAETAALRAMRWFFLVLIALWIFAAMALPVIAFCFTQNLLSFSLYGSLAPPVYILRRIIWHIFPKDDRDYKLAEAKAKYAALKQSHNKRLKNPHGTDHE